MSVDISRHSYSWYEMNSKDLINFILQIIGKYNLIKRHVTRFEMEFKNHVFRNNIRYIIYLIYITLLIS